MALTSPLDIWAVAHVPAAAAQATASRAAGGAGVRHIARRCIGTIATIAATAQTPLGFNLRDGATGAGTIVGAWALAAVGTTFAAFDTGSGSLDLPGTANTAMTLESSGAGVASSLATATLLGYDLP
jgi:hypothetical protein